MGVSFPVERMYEWEYDNKKTKECVQYYMNRIWITNIDRKNIINTTRKQRANSGKLEKTQAIEPT